MVAIVQNPYANRGVAGNDGWQMLRPETSAHRVIGLLQQCPVAHDTPLTAQPKLAQKSGVAEYFIKDERTRMGLGSFKALGAAFAIAVDASETSSETIDAALTDQVYVAASAGNHGLSVAAGARLFGARAVIYLAETVPQAFALLLESYGAEVVRAGAVYEASMEAAKQAAADNGWTLLSDSSWPDYTEEPMKVMEGYLKLADEVVQQLPGAPSHIFLQAGVGGMAVALAAYFRANWGTDPTIVIVEPEAAPALMESIKAGESVVSSGPTSQMGRLDCKEPSLIALAGLAEYANFFVTLSESEVADKLALFADCGCATSPSGGAGMAAVLAMSQSDRTELGLDADSRVLCVLSEADPT